MNAEIRTGTASADAVDFFPIAIPGSDEAHVHPLVFASHLRPAARLSAWLSPDESKRANDLRDAPLRERFILSHAFTRAVIAAYLGRHPRSIRFAAGPHGKPFITGDDPRGRRLGFSLAHCDTHAVVAIAAHPWVGVDVEQLRPQVDARAIARRYFAPAEVAALERLPRADADLYFLRLWTCKEAFLKAIGRGLSYPLDRVCVRGLENDEPVFDLAEPEFGPSRMWSLRTWRATPDCSIALAVRQPGRLTVRMFPAGERLGAWMRQWDR